MSDRLKRTLLIFAFVLFACGIGYLLYSVFFQRAPIPGEPVPSGEIVTPGGLPLSDETGERGTETPGGESPTTPLPIGGTPAGSGGSLPVSAVRTRLLNEGISRDVSPTVSGQGARFYDPASGKFYTVDANGLITPLSDKTFSNVDTVAWGNATDKAILTFPDGSNVLYDFTAQKQTTLPKHWDDFAFSGNDTKIIAKSEADAPESRYLVIANPDGSGAQAIEPLGENSDKAFPAWTPNNEVVAYATTGQAKGFDRQEIILIGKNHENYSALLVEGRGFEPLWSPSGQTVLYSVWTVANEYKPELWISGGAPGNVNQDRRKLSVLTWAHKCVWVNELEIICAVPEEMPSGAGLYPDQFQDTTDRIVRINIEENLIIDLGQPDGGPSVKNPVLSNNGSELIFSDAMTGKLYTFTIL